MPGIDLKAPELQNEAPAVTKVRCCFFVITVYEASNSRYPEENAQLNRTRRPREDVTEFENPKMPA